MLPTVIRHPKTAQDIAAGVRLTRMNGKDQVSPAAVARVLRTGR